MPPFHLAFPVHDLAAARAFYGGPVRHFGLVLPMADWQALADRLTGQVEFLIAPYIRFTGQPGEQATMFFHDPSGNAIEIKAFANMDQLFAT